MVARSIEEIFDDLLNLEINIIIKSDVTARKMPELPEALSDVTVKYRDYLVTLSWEQGDERIDLGHSPEDLAADDLFEKLIVDFNRLAAEANRLRATGEIRQRDDGTPGVLMRISRTSKRLAEILERMQTEKSESQQAWPKDDLLVLRKAWEVGVEMVAIQTVAQIDGDIVTRIQPTWATAQYEGLHAVHTRLVSTSLEHWRYLFATVATLTLETIQSVFFRERPSKG